MYLLNLCFYWILICDCLLCYIQRPTDLLQDVLVKLFGPHQRLIDSFLNQSKLNGQTHKCLLEMNQTGSAWRLREPFQFIKNCCSLLQTTRAPSWPPEGFQQPGNSVWDLLGAFRTFWNSRETTLLTCYGCHAIVSWQYISWTHLVPMFTPAAVVIGMAL